MAKVAIVVAMSENRVIGKDGNLPWRLPRDMSRFVELTGNNIVVMGRKTWDSIPDKFKPLKRRINLVLSRDPEFKPEGCSVFSNLQTAIRMVQELEPKKKIFVIGGESVYKEALRLGIVEQMFITMVHARFEGDTFFPEINGDEWKATGGFRIPRDKENEYDMSFLLFERKKVRRTPLR